MMDASTCDRSSNAIVDGRLGDRRIQHVAGSISASRVLLVLRKSDISEIDPNNTQSGILPMSTIMKQSASHTSPYRQTSCGSLNASRIRPRVVFDLRRPTDTLRRRESGVLISKACKTLVIMCGMTRLKGYLIDTLTYNRNHNTRSPETMQ